MKNIKIIAATVAGAIGGALAGMLFAPDKGSATRKKIKKEGDEYLKALKEEVEAKRAELRRQARETRDEAGKLGREARRKGEELTKRARKMTSYDEWTYDELYQRAKERGIKNYSTMRKAELIEALRKR